MLGLLRNTLYGLKRRHGKRLQIQFATEDVNVETGAKIINLYQYTIKRAIPLPRAGTLSEISLAPGFRYGGTYETGTELFLIDRGDLPKNVEVTTEHWIIYNGKRYNVTNIINYEDYGFILEGKNIINSYRQALFDIKIEDNMNLNDGVIQL